MVWTLGRAAILFAAGLAIGLVAWWAVESLLDRLARRVRKTG